MAWRPGPAAEAARALRVRRRGHRAHRRVDALDGGAVGAGPWQGAAGEHRWGGDEAHRGGRVAGSGRHGGVPVGGRL
jgi:hypothetical protein